MEQYKTRRKMMNFGYDSTLPPKRNAIMEGLLTALKWFLPPLYVTAWIVNIDNVKSTILFIMAVIGFCIHQWHKYQTNKQDRRLKDIEIRKKENELK